MKTVRQTSSSGYRARSASNRARRGLGLVELLICASIGSMLLTAVGIAYNASFNSYRDNQQRGQMLNSGRDFMSDIIADVRMSDAGGPYDPGASVMSTENTQFNNIVVPGNPSSGPASAGGSGTIGVQLLKSHADAVDPGATSLTPVLITYWWDKPNSQILMTRSLNGTTTQRTVCTCVQNFQLFLQPVQIPANPQTGTVASVALLRAAVNISLVNRDVNGNRIINGGGQNLTLSFSDSAMPRRTFGGI
jgi:hypothetical protein